MRNKLDLQHIKDIACVVVFYNPGSEIISRWKSLSKRNDYISFIFVDNTPSEIGINSELSNSKEFLNYIPLHSNQGIAKAQNVGIKRAENLGAEYIVFFDQDSEPTNELIFGLKESFVKYSNTSKIAAVGPKVIDRCRTGNEISDSNRTSNVETLISSGTITSISVLNDVGLMEEALFIDLVDHEWCWRAKSKGYQILRDNTLRMCHKIGKGNVVFWGAHLHITSPTRYFFTFRNSRRLIMRKYVPTHWKICTIRHNLILLLFIPFCKDFNGAKIAILKNAIIGLFTK